MDRQIGILHVATNLGLRPGGVERLGSTLIELGLAERLDAGSPRMLQAPAYDSARHPLFGTRNVEAIASFASEQAGVVGQMLTDGQFPVVLGGDDSVLLGCLLAVRRRGTSGLLFLDGHTDFWDFGKTLADEFSESDLWVVTGHGPEILADLEGRKPLVEPRACVIYGHRDRAEQLATRSEDIYQQPMLVRSLAELRSIDLRDAANHAISFLKAAEPDSVWLHLDADCLDDDLMPAVDWRDKGGLSAEELVALLRPLLDSGLVAGMDVTIYNPALDTEDLAAGRLLCNVLNQALGPTAR
jgi:arginase